MASAITHAVVGAAIGASWRPGWRVPLACAGLSVAPDLDVVMHAFVDYSHFLGHRGFFHSPGFYALVALGIYGATRCRDVAVLVFLAMLSHSILDAMTDGGYGPMLFFPPITDRVFLPWTPIPVSPLSIADFIGPRGLAILQVEVWFMLAAAMAAVAVRLARRQTRG